MSVVARRTRPATLTRAWVVRCHPDAGGRTSGPNPASGLPTPGGVRRNHPCAPDDPDDGADHAAVHRLEARDDDQSLSAAPPYRRPSIPCPPPLRQSPASLGVDPATGLSADEVRSRLASHGANRLAGGKKEPAWRAFLRQYEDFMQVILLAAALVNQLVTGTPAPRSCWPA